MLDQPKPKIMKRFITCIFYCLVFFQLAGQPICNNEDFESGTGGAITNSTAIAGWSIHKLQMPVSPLISNCAVMTHTAVSRINPTAVYLFTANSIIDTIIGSNYPIYSVFGSGPLNGGSSVNPLIPEMRGNSFLRLGDASGTSLNHHEIEKTISVTSSNALFRFAYISVVKGGSSCCDAPSVQVKFLNASQGNTLLPCPIYSVSAPVSSCANPNTPPMIPSPSTLFTMSDVFYHKWKVEAVDLSPYIGSNVTFKMLVTYCSQSCSKYAYSYLDAQCSPMEVTVNGTPFPANTNSVTFTGCSVQTATVIAPPDFSGYQWTGPGGFTSTLSTITTAAAGVYTLNILTSGTCSTITKFVNIKLVSAPSVSITTTKTVACKGDALKLVALGLTSFTWNVPGNSATLTTSPANTSTFTVSGYDVNGCFGTASITQSVVTCAEINEYTMKGGISVFPNPNQGEFIIRMTEISSAKLTLSSITGQLVHTQTLTSGENKVKSNNLAPGVYYYKVEYTGQLYATGKIHIE